MNGCLMKQRGVSGQAKLIGGPTDHPILGGERINHNDQTINHEKQSGGKQVPFHFVLLGPEM